MKRVIHKHALRWASEVQDIQTPIGSRVVHVAIQNDVPTVWVEREVGGYADNHPGVIHIQMTATGQEFERTSNDSAIYLTTVHQGWTVWHFYQMKDGAP